MLPPSESDSKPFLALKSPILDGSARLAYRFVVLSSALEIASFPLFQHLPASSDLPHFLQRRTSKSGSQHGA